MTLVLSKLFEMKTHFPSVRRKVVDIKFISKTTYAFESMSTRSPTSIGCLTKRKMQAPRTS